MVKNYVKILWRRLFSEKASSLIHIGGLAIGIGAALVILIYGSFEQRFDVDLKYADQLHRLNLTSYSNEELVEKGARTSPAMGETSTKEIAALEDYSRVVILGEVIAGFEDQFVRPGLAVSLFCGGDTIFLFHSVRVAGKIPDPNLIGMVVFRAASNGDSAFVFGDKVLSDGQSGFYQPV